MQNERYVTKGQMQWDGECNSRERLSVLNFQVASFMRAVLRTLSQCHSHRILHRDIKPGNFMLLNDADRAPLKAIGRRWLEKHMQFTESLSCNCCCRFWSSSFL